MSRYRLDNEYKNVENKPKPKWSEIIFTKQILTLSKIIIGFIIVYIASACWYGMVEIKERIIR
jgi:hypothetical protein